MTPVLVLLKGSLIFQLLLAFGLLAAVVLTLQSQRLWPLLMLLIIPATVLLAASYGVVAQLGHSEPVTTWAGSGLIPGCLAILTIIRAGTWPLLHRGSRR